MGYVSGGAWPQNSNSMSDEKSLYVKNLNERVQLRQDRATGDMFHKRLELDELGSPNNVTQYTGAIAKTTDGGKTWKKVFQQDGSFYFNGIHCHDEEHCIAVARMTSATEGWAAGGLGSTLSFEGRFWHTMDAGNTWTKEPLKGMLAMGIDCSD